MADRIVLHNGKPVLVGGRILLADSTDPEECLCICTFNSGTTEVVAVTAHEYDLTGIYIGPPYPIPPCSAGGYRCTNCVDLGFTVTAPRELANPCAWRFQETAITPWKVCTTPLAPPDDEFEYYFITAQLALGLHDKGGGLWALRWVARFTLQAFNGATFGNIGSQVVKEIVTWTDGDPDFCVNLVDYSDTLTDLLGGPEADCLYCNTGGVMVEGA